MFVFVFVALNVLGVVVHLALDKAARTPRRVVEVVLLWVLVVNGLAALFAFFGHAFDADAVAASIGWPAGSPFQFEVAVANLAFGVLGVLCVWLRGRFWLATGLGSSIFLLGAAYGHIREIIVNHNDAPNNAGPILYSDILYPVAMLVLLALYWRLGDGAADGRRPPG
ncbi:MAG TPA: DUF6790 family protein [Chloroflexota bacterium]|jgi:hypothetical protein